jgi:O-acetylserine/cysteine efflux transporter
MLRFMVWVSALAVLPLYVLSTVFEGPQRGWDALRTVTWPAVGSVFYVGLLATVAGFGLWGWLIRTYSASVIAPFSLLVPVFGMSAAALFDGERLTALRMCAAVLIIAGVLFGLLRRMPLRRKETGSGVVAQVVLVDVQHRSDRGQELEDRQ